MNEGTLVRQTTKNVLAKAGAEGGSRLLGVLFVLLAARALGPEGFGKLTFAAALAALFSAALELGLRPIVIRDVARAPETLEHSWRTVSALNLLAGGLLLPLLPLVALGLHRPWDTVGAVALMGVFGFVSAFHELGIAVFTAMRAQQYELLLRLLSKALLVVVALGAATAGGGVVALTAAYPLSALLTLPLLLRIVRRWSPHLGPLWDPPESLRLWREAWPLAAATLFLFSSWRLPPLLLALLREDAEVGYFGAAFRLVETLGFVPAILVSAIFPVLSESYGRDETRLRSTVEKTFGLLYLLACPLAVGTMFLAGPILRLVYGSAFDPATPMLSVLIWANAFNFLNFLLIYTFTSLRHQHEVTRIAAMALGLSLLLAPPLIARVGGVGAGAGLVAAEAVFTLVGTLRLRRILGGLRLWTMVPQVSLATGVMSLGLWGAGGLSLWIQLLVALLCYVGSLSVFRPLSRQELILFWRALAKRSE